MPPCTPWSHIEYGAGNYGKEGESPLQYEILFLTLEDLISSQGNSGIFIVNDKTEEVTRFAALKLKQYCIEHNYQNIRLIKYPGDFTEIEPPTTYSAHIKNVHPNFLLHSERGTLLIEKLAAPSETGLVIHTDSTESIRHLQELGFVFEKLGRVPGYVYGYGDMLGVQITKIGNRGYRFKL